MSSSRTAPTSDPRPSATTGTPAATAPLRGTTWYYVSRINNDLKIDQPADPDAWIRFGPDSLTFNGTVERAAGDQDSPCPTWTAQVRVDRDEVELAGSSRNDEDSRFICGSRFLSNGVRPANFVLRGRTLSVHLDEGQNQSTLVFSADPPAAPSVTAPDLSFLPTPNARTAREVLDANPLRGRNFRVESITGRSLAGKGVTLQFGVDQVGLNAGCNGGGAGYTIDGDRMNFTPGSWTAMACSEKGVMDQESWLGRFASGTARFSLEGSRLTISKGSTAVVLSETPGSSSEPADPDPSTFLAITTVDEIVDNSGSRPMPVLEKGKFWYEPSLTLSSKRLVFDVGCGQYIADFSGSFPDITLPIGDGTILHDCPPTRSALAGALRYILSGPVTVDRDGAFFTFTGRDGLKVTAHSGYQSG